MFFFCMEGYYFELRLVKIFGHVDVDDRFFFSLFLSEMRFLFVFVLFVGHFGCKIGRYL